MRVAVIGTIILGVLASQVSAQSAIDPVAVAEAQGVCAPFGVASATLTPDGAIRAVCNEDATAFVPLLGGLGPALGVGAAAAVAAAVAGGNATPDTQ